MNRQSGSAEVNGTRLCYETAGSGDALVFIHGFGADSRTWDAQFDAFAARYRVVRYDMRGFGRSAVPKAAPYTHTGDLIALLDSLGIAQACVIGQSMGGGVAIDFVLAYPQTVCGLVLVDSFLEGYDFAEWEETWGAVFGIAATQGTQASLAFMIGLPAFETLRANPALESRLVQIWSDYSGWHFANRDPVQNVAPQLYTGWSRSMCPRLSSSASMILRTITRSQTYCSSGSPVHRRSSCQALGTYL